MKFLILIFVGLFVSCTEELSDFGGGGKVFEKDLVGYWLLHGKMETFEAGLVSQRTIKSLSIDSSGVFLLEMMQLDADTDRPAYVAKYAGWVSTENDEITLTAKRKFHFHSEFAGEYAEWKKLDEDVYDGHSYILRGDSLTIEDLKDDIIGAKEVFIKIN